MGKAEDLIESLAEVVDSERGLGTAFCVAPGWWLTAAHVIGQRGEVNLLPANDCASPRVAMAATVRATATELDVALIRCEDTRGTALTLSRSSPAAGAAWRSAGFPLPDSQRSKLGTLLPIAGHYAGSTQKAGLAWLRSSDVAPGISGAPICHENTLIAWAFVSHMLTATLWPSRALDFNVGVRLEDALSALGALAAEFPQDQIRWTDIEQLEEYRRQEHSGWRMVWPPFEEARWRQRTAHPETPFFVHGDLPSPADVARGDVYPRTATRRALSFLTAQTGASIVLVDGGSASGKSCIGLLIAWEMHSLGARIYGALPGVRAIPRSFTQTTNPIILLLDDGRLHTGFLERLKAELPEWSGPVSLIVVDPPEAGRRSSYFKQIVEEFDREHRLLRIDSTPSYAEVQLPRILDHVDGVFLRWKLSRRLPFKQKDDVLDAIPADSRLLKRLFGEFGKTAQRGEDAGAGPRPTWLTKKLEEWTATVFAMDIVLPWPLAQRATPGFPFHSSIGAFGDLQWTEEGFSFGHSDQARSFPVADRRERAVEILDAALGADESAFVFAFGEVISDPQHGLSEVVDTCLRRTEAFSSNASLRDAEAALLAVVSRLGHLSGAPLLDLLLRLDFPESPRGLFHYVDAIWVSVAWALANDRGEEILDLTTALVPLVGEEAYWSDLLAVVLCEIVGEGRKTGHSALALEALESLRTLTRSSQATEPQRTCCISAMVIEHAAASSKRRDTAEGVDQNEADSMAMDAALEDAGNRAVLLAEVRELVSRDDATEVQRNVWASMLGLEVRSSADERSSWSAWVYPTQEERNLRQPPAEPNRTVRLSLLDELRRLAARSSATEEQRNELAKAIRSVHDNAVQGVVALLAQRADGLDRITHEQFANPDLELSARLLSELRELAVRPASTEEQRDELAAASSAAILISLELRDANACQAALSDLRSLAEQDTASVPQQVWLASGLFMVHLRAVRSGDRAAAAQLLDELHRLVRKARNLEALQDQIAAALFETVCFGDHDAAAASLVELRAMAMGQAGTDTQRNRFAEALAKGALNALRIDDPSAADALLSELRALALRSDATSEQRDALGRALFNAQVRANCDENLEASAQHVSELLVLACSEQATPVQREAFLRAVVQAHALASDLGDLSLSLTLVSDLRTFSMRYSRSAPDADAIANALVVAYGDACEKNSDAAAIALEGLREIATLHGTLRYQEVLVAALDKAHALATIGGDLVSASALLGELRSLAEMVPTSTMIGDTLALCIARAHMYACEHLDAQALSELLMELHRLAVQDTATRRQRELLAAVLRDTYVFTREVGDTKSAEQVLTELRRLAANEGASAAQVDAFAATLLQAVQGAFDADNGPLGLELLAEIGALATIDAATEFQRDSFAEALADAYMSAFAGGHHTAAEQLLSELRSLSTRTEATWLQRLALCKALASNCFTTTISDSSPMMNSVNELRSIAFGNGSPEVAKDLLAAGLCGVSSNASDERIRTDALTELRALAMSDEATEVQRNWLSQALQFAHGFAQTAGDAASAAKIVDELSAIASRADATDVQRESFALVAAESPPRRRPRGKQKAKPKAKRKR